MKKISLLLALIALFFTGIALAGAGVTTLNGTAQVQRGTAPAHALRLGDEVNQGDTVSTGANSSIVLKFDDGHVAALTSNSRMTIDAYEYDPQSQKGNVLLTLVDGGMRAVTGLIGRNFPGSVSYRAAAATIGIRGTDVIVVSGFGAVVVTVEAGRIEFTFRGRTVTVRAGEGVDARTDGQFQQAAAEAIMAKLDVRARAAIRGLQGLMDAINRAAAGTPRHRTDPSGFRGTDDGGRGGTTGGDAGGGGGKGPQPGSPH